MQLALLVQQRALERLIRFSAEVLVLLVFPLLLPSLLVTRGKLDTSRLPIATPLRPRMRRRSVVSTESGSELRSAAGRSEMLVPPPVGIAVGGDRESRRLLGRWVGTKRGSGNWADGFGLERDEVRGGGCSSSRWTRRDRCSAGRSWKSKVVAVLRSWEIASVPRARGHGLLRSEGSRRGVALIVVL